MPQSQPTLPTNRAFVVQFHAQTSEALSAYEGRIEHVVSGQVARFHSLEELLAFMCAATVGLAVIAAAADEGRRPRAVFSWLWNS
jgi:hypothetical protein